MNTQSETASGGRILIIDDDPVITGLLTVALSSAGHDIVEANSGEAALALLAGLGAASLPEIIFLDIEMWDGIDGYETCRRLKANPATSHIPVIFLTGKSEPAYELLGLALGAVDYIAKPLTPAVICTRAALALAAVRGTRRGVA